MCEVLVSSLLGNYLFFLSSISKLAKKNLVLHARFAIPFGYSTSLGLTVRALDLPLTATEAGDGLVPPAASVAILGKAGAASRICGHSGESWCHHDNDYHINGYHVSFHDQHPHQIQSNITDQTFREVFLPRLRVSRKKGGD
jgi:hypothetical protein